VPVGVRDQVARHKGQICMTATSRPSTEFPHRTADLALGSRPAIVIMRKRIFGT
jgi:hypothetical protein